MKNLPEKDSVKYVPVEIFCQFWANLGCIPASYLEEMMKIKTVKQNINNCAIKVYIDTMDFDANILLNLKNLQLVHVKTKWTINPPLAQVLTSLYKQGVKITFAQKITPYQLVDCQLFKLTSVIIPTYTYKEIEELIYLLLDTNSYKSCIKCIMKLKPMLKQRVQNIVSYAITTEYTKQKPNLKRIEEFKSLIK